MKASVLLAVLAVVSLISGLIPLALVFAGLAYGLRGKKTLPAEPEALPRPDASARHRIEPAPRRDTAEQLSRPAFSYTDTDVATRASVPNPTQRRRQAFAEARGDQLPLRDAPGQALNGDVLDELTRLLDRS